MANLVDLAQYEPAFQNLGIRLYTGSGAPTVSAPQGSLYINLAGTTTNDRMYINTDGSTTWTAFTTAA